MFRPAGSTQWRAWSRTGISPTSDSSARSNHPTEGSKIELNNPNKFSEGLRSEQTPAPFLGGQSIEILAELGYGEAEIKAMIETQTTHDGRRSEAS